MSEYSDGEAERELVDAALTEAEVEAYYKEHGWSGCAGSAWSRLPQATKDGWAHAARLAARTSAAVEQERERIAVAIEEEACGCVTAGPADTPIEAYRACARAVADAARIARGTDA
jgi:hypothetical protein